MERWLGLLALAGCGGVVVFEGEPGAGGGGAAATSTSTTSQSVAVATVGVTTVGSTTTGGGAGPRALCLEYCDAVERACGGIPDCVDFCITELVGDYRCYDELEALLRCYAENLVECEHPLICDDPYFAWDTCWGGFEP